MSLKSFLIPLMLGLLLVPAASMADERSPLPVTPAPPKPRSTLVMGLTGGLGLDHFYRTAVYGGFAELLLGGEVGPVELSARLRGGAGRTESGLLVGRFSAGLGLLGRVHPRVYLGFSASLFLGGLFVQRVTKRDVMQTPVFELLPELRVDLHKGEHGAFYLATFFGVTGVVPLLGQGALFSPTLLVGLGYRVIGAGH